MKNCETFFVPADSLNNLVQLNGLRFDNISKLVLREYSFKSTRERPTIRLEIFNSTVPDLPPHFIKGNLDELIIVDSNVTKIHVFALTGFFSDISVMKFKNTQIGKIDAQAFKKLTIHNLEILDTTFQMNSASRTFYDCHIRSIAIEGSHFTLLQPSTFDVKEVQRLRIYNSTFGVIEGEAFMMDVSDRAIFSNNSVNMLHHGAFKGKKTAGIWPRTLRILFKGITMHPKTPTTRTQDVYFEFNNNHVNFVHPEQDVGFCPDMKLQLSKLYLRDARNCEAVGRIYENKFFNDNSNSIFMRIEERDEDFESISYLNDRCRSESNWLLILAIIVAVILLVVIVLTAIFCYLRSKKKHLDIVMPEPRTYRQTQIVMQVETHGLMKTDF